MICLRTPQPSAPEKGCLCWWATLAQALFWQDDNALLLVDEQGAKELPRDTKTRLARDLIQDIARRLSK